MIQANQSFKTSLVLASIALLATSLLAVIHHLTRSAIDEAEQLSIQAQLNQLLPKNSHTNNLLTDTLTLYEPETLGHRQAVTVYRARQDNQAVAVILPVVARNGYNGDIKLLIGIAVDGRITGVRVTSHKETPGLGDGIDESKSDWILSFNDLSLQNTLTQQWTVKKDGGVIDQFTGATITPRAVTQAIHKALIYVNTAQDELFMDPR